MHPSQQPPGQPSYSYPPQPNSLPAIQPMQQPQGRGPPPPVMNIPQDGINQTSSSLDHRPTMPNYVDSSSNMSFLPLSQSYRPEKQKSSYYGQPTMRVNANASLKGMRYIDGFFSNSPTAQYPSSLSPSPSSSDMEKQSQTKQNIYSTSSTNFLTSRIPSDPNLWPPNYTGSDQAHPTNQPQNPSTTNYGPAQAYPPSIITPMIANQQSRQPLNNQVPTMQPSRPPLNKPVITAQTRQSLLNNPAYTTQQSTPSLNRPVIATQSRPPSVNRPGYTTQRSMSPSVNRPGYATQRSMPPLLNNPIPTTQQSMPSLNSSIPKTQQSMPSLDNLIPTTQQSDPSSSATSVPPNAQYHANSTLHPGSNSTVYPDRVDPSSSGPSSVHTGSNAPIPFQDIQQQSFMHQMRISKIEDEASDMQHKLGQQQEKLKRQSTVLQMALALQTQINCNNTPITGKPTAFKACQSIHTLRHSMPAEGINIASKPGQLLKGNRIQSAILSNSHSSFDDHNLPEPSISPVPLDSVPSSTSATSETVPGASVFAGYYTSILDTIKVVATSTVRITKFVSNFGIQLLNPKSEEHCLFQDMLSHLARSTHTLVELLRESALKIQDDRYPSLLANARNLFNSVKLMVSLARERLEQSSTSSSSLNPSNELATALSNTRQDWINRAIAINVQIKSLARLLDEIKMDYIPVDRSNVDNIWNETTAAIEQYKQSYLELNTNIHMPPTIKSQEKWPLPPQERRDIASYSTSVSLSLPSSIDLSKYNIEYIRLLQRVIRKYLVHHRFHSLFTKIQQDPLTEELRIISHRKKILMEVSTSEATYITALETLKLHFFDPMKQLESINPPIIHVDLGDFHDMFESLEMILKFSNALLSDIQSRLELWPTNQLFGDIFIKHSDNMIIYSAYVNGFDKTQDAYKEMCQEQSFGLFERQCMELSGQRLGLQALMIMPIQRVPRYGLFLRELISYSDPEHVDYQNLVDAQMRVNEVCQTINNKKREYDNVQKMAQIQDDFVQFPGPDNPSYQKLREKGRLFIKEALIQMEKDKETYGASIYLFNDLILLGKANNKNNPRPPYSFLDLIHLDKVNAASIKKRKKAIRIWDKTGLIKAEWIFYFESEAIASSWLKHILDSISSLELQVMLDYSLNQSENQGVPVDVSAPKIKQNEQTLRILSAIYGDLNTEDATIDVTRAIQNMVKMEGGRSLNLPATSKGKLPGFTSIAKTKKKALMITYMVGSIALNKTFRDDSPVTLTCDQIEANT